MSREEFLSHSGDPVIDLLEKWGGGTPMLGHHTVAPEKRLELDFPMAGVLNTTGWGAVIRSLECTPISRHVSPHMCSIICDRCLIVICQTRVVITAASDVPLHIAVGSLVQLMSQFGLKAHWVSYVRKNIGSGLFGEGAGEVGQEYGYLKHNYPTGHPYFLGPVDGQHHFYFVFDNIARGGEGGVVEDDVQINLVMHDLTNEVGNDHDLALIDTVELFSSHDVHHAYQEGCGYQACCVLGDGFYETLRVHHLGEKGSCATFETNIPVRDQSKRIDSLLDAFKPKSFSVLVLSDPQSVLANCMLRSAHFIGEACKEKYVVVQETMNEFAAGYNVQHGTFKLKRAVSV